MIKFKSQFFYLIMLTVLLACSPKTQSFRGSGLAVASNSYDSNNVDDNSDPSSSPSASSSASPDPSEIPDPIPGDDDPDPDDGDDDDNQNVDVMCPAGQFLVGIQNNEPICQNISLICPAGKYLYGIDANLNPICADKALRYVSVATGRNTTCFVGASDDLDNGVFCVGLKSRGQVGDASVKPTYTQAFKQVIKSGANGEHLTGVTKLSGSGDQFCALDKNGEVFCWGRNNQGQLGLGHKTNTTIATKVILGASAIDVSVGFFHSCAVLNTGKGMCWGYNGKNTNKPKGDGRLGDTEVTSVNSTLPLEVKAISGKLKKIFTSYDSTCAMREDNTVGCWGVNRFGVFGNGNTTSSKTAVDVKLSNIDKVVIGTDRTTDSANYAHACYITTDKKLYCTGYNNASGYSVLGIGKGSGQYKSTPVQGLKDENNDGVNEGPLEDVVAVAVGGFRTCAVQSTGKVWCTGSNSHGQLGNGTTKASFFFIPVKNVAGDGVFADAGSSIAASDISYGHTCFVTKSGKALCQGYNYYGQLGNGTRNASTKPVSIVGQ